MYVYGIIRYNIKLCEDFAKIYLMTYDIITKYKIK